MRVYSAIVLALCFRVTFCHLSDRIDLPKVESIEMGRNAFSFKESRKDGVTNTLTMRSPEVSVK